MQDIFSPGLLSSGGAWALFHYPPKGQTLAAEQSLPPDLAGTAGSNYTTAVFVENH